MGVIFLDYLLPIGDLLVYQMFYGAWACWATHLTRYSFVLLLIRPQGMPNLYLTAQIRGTICNCMYCCFFSSKILTSRNLCIRYMYFQPHWPKWNQWQFSWESVCKIKLLTFIQKCSMCFIHTRRLISVSVFYPLCLVDTIKCYPVNTKKFPVDRLLFSLKVHF